MVLPDEISGKLLQKKEKAYFSLEQIQRCGGS